jgi:hypothetical protein
MWFDKDNPIVMLGDIVELKEPGEWMRGSGYAGSIIVPAGTRGEVVPWTLPGWEMGTAIHFVGVDHPEYLLFPMLTHKPRLSRYPDSITLISRNSQHDHPVEPLPRAGMSEGQAAGNPHVQAPLEAGPSGLEAQRAHGGAPGLGKPSPQGRGQGRPQRRAGTVPNQKVP